MTPAARSCGFQIRRVICKTSAAECCATGSLAGPAMGACWCEEPQRLLTLAYCILRVPYGAYGVSFPNGGAGHSATRRDDISGVRSREGRGRQAQAEPPTAWLRCPCKSADTPRTFCPAQNLCRRSGPQGQRAGAGAIASGCAVPRPGTPCLWLLAGHGVRQSLALGDVVFGHRLSSGAVLSGEGTRL